MHDTPQDMHSLQQEDLLMFGQVVFALCCNNVAASIKGDTFFCLVGSKDKTFMTLSSKVKLVVS
jgi:hypothetical protein